MSYAAEPMGPADRERWNDLVRDSPEATPFHLYEALETFADASGTTLHPLVTRKGQEPVGLFPLFERRVGPVPVAFSPPPSLKIEYLGPALVERQALKPRRRERNRSHLVETSIEWMDERIDPRYVNVRTSAVFDDPRPFVWRDWSLTPRHTYEVDLDRDPDDLFMAFSSDARSNVREADEYDVEVYEAGPDAIAPILELVRDRHEKQDVEFPLTAEFVRALHEATPDGVVRPYACDLDGELVGGTICLEHDETAMTWTGTAKRDVPIAPNDLLQWHSMQAAMDRGCTRYDLVGANLERTAGFKAKFAPDLERYYRLERATPPARVAARVYDQVR